jgi:hypothetical protein
MLKNRKATNAESFRFFNKVFENEKMRKTSILRVLQAIPSPLPVVYSIKVVQEDFDF